MREGSLLHIHACVRPADDRVHGPPQPRHHLRHREGTDEVTTLLASGAATDGGGALCRYPDGARQRAGVAVTSRVSDAVFKLPKRVLAFLYEFVAQRLPLPSPPAIRVLLEIPNIRNHCHVPYFAVPGVATYSNARCVASRAAGALHTALNVQRSGASAHVLVILS